MTSELTIEPLTPFIGAELTGVDLRAVTEEQVKLLMRAERAERRASAIEEEMTEAARQNAREIANLKLKLAEKEARRKSAERRAASRKAAEEFANEELDEAPKPRRRRGSVAALRGTGIVAARSPQRDQCFGAGARTTTTTEHRRVRYARGTSR